MNTSCSASYDITGKVVISNLLKCLPVEATIFTKLLVDSCVD